MGISHLEDFVLEDPRRGRRLIRDIVLKQAPLYLKWDGSPAFAIGPGFVALKNGWLRKDPVLFRDEESITSYINDPDLAAKLSLMLNKMAHKTKKPLMGDFLFDKVENCRFRPNQVEYEVDPLASHILEAELGVVIHSDSDEIGEFGFVADDVFMAAVRPDTHWVSQQQLLSDPVFGIEAPLLRLTPTEKLKLQKYVNSHVRDGDINIDPDEFMEVGELSSRSKERIEAEELRKLFNMYLQVIYWKQEFLNDVKVDYVIQPAEGHSHEGFVTECEGTLVKIVDRLKFSHQNFKRHQNGREGIS